MENDIFNATKSTTALNSLVLDETSSQFSNSHIHPQAFDLNIQNQFMSGYSVIPHLDEQPTVYEFHDRYSEGMPISCSVLASLLATRNSVQQNVNCNLSHSSFDTSLNVGYDSVLGGSTNSRWDFDKYLPLPELSIKHPEISVFLPFQLFENDDPDGWISAHNNTNELSLSLATTQPSVVCGTAVTEQCSDMTSLGRLGSDQTTSDGRDLSLSFGSFRPAQLSQVTTNSSYLNVVQEIFTEIASFSVENFDQRSFSTRGIGNEGCNIPCFSTCFTDEFTNEEGRQLENRPVWQRRDIEAKKSQLLSLLQVVDERYNQCMDEIHTVISAFHAATELNPQIHARFALHTISLLYRNLRERISTQILTMPSSPRNECTNEKDGSSLDTSFIQKQWALQQLRRKEHQLWRPQRGLPERSVSVLRAWMFQNFLHPYPKDAEKHLLAVKSGLTRSQVSNWFINARVRLWKPMIEEMYSELNRRKARRSDEGDVNIGGIGHENMENNQRFKLNEEVESSKNY